jgi:HAD superfamily hydrolase (TIGR01484 family)
MRYHALACDYDGTLAWHGSVEESTLAALQRLLKSGRKLILVTGRELEDLLRVFPHLDLFDRVVAENGALLYCPASREEKILAKQAPTEFVNALRQRGVNPLSVGRVIVATVEPYETITLQTIRDLGLELQVIFNKGAVMVLPSNVNKATGLRAALTELHLSHHNVVGVGDAENDHAFLDLCECSVAVANALPAVKEHVDFVTKANHGAGVVELIENLVGGELRELEGVLERHEIMVGLRENGEEVRIKPYGMNVLVAGTSGGGKSTFVTGFLEGLVEHDFQFCIVDPEGDYAEFEKAIILGDSKRTPTAEEIIKVLENPAQSVVVNLIGTKLEDRPAYFQRLLASLLELRTRTARPHWIVIDEAHHVLPAFWKPSSPSPGADIHGVLLVTVNPDTVAPSILSTVDLIVAIGDSPGQTIRSFSETIELGPPPVPPSPLQTGEAIAWWRRLQTAPFWFRSIPPKAERRRHIRKYAEGELAPEQSFYFEGPEKKLKLRAQNLNVFMQLAEGVDQDTWIHHLRQDDYARWFRECIKDQDLADEAERIRNMPGLSPEESRALIRAAIEQRYTAPA